MLDMHQTLKQLRKRPLEIIRSKAEAGDAESQFHLGLCKQHGIQCEIDEAAAFDWIQSSATNGYLPAKYCLAGCYLLGMGIERDTIKAFHIFQNLATLGDPSALYHVGFCFENGLHGSSPDLQEAVRYYEEAKRRGSQEANHRLAELKREQRQTLKKENISSQRGTKQKNKERVQQGQEFNATKVELNAYFRQDSQKGSPWMRFIESEMEALQRIALPVGDGFHEATRQKTEVLHRVFLHGRRLATGIDEENRDMLFPSKGFLPLLGLRITQSRVDRIQTTTESRAVQKVFDKTTP